MDDEKRLRVHPEQPDTSTLYWSYSDLEGRVWEHKEGKIAGFTKTYKINQLVYYEDYPDMLSAIAREKQLKGWSRAKKIALIEIENPKWEELRLR